MDKIGDVINGAAHLHYDKVLDHLVAHPLVINLVVFLHVMVNTFTINHVIEKLLVSMVSHTRWRVHPIIPTVIRFIEIILDVCRRGQERIGITYSVVRRGLVGNDEKP